jgi:hypothetical protein
MLASTSGGATGIAASVLAAPEENPQGSVKIIDHGTARRKRVVRQEFRADRTRDAAWDLGYAFGA